MDPLATAAEIVAILQAAETVPSVGHRRASRAERLEAYLAYQRETYKFMAGVNHLSFLGQLKTFTWRTTGTVWIPMIGPFVDFVLSDDLSERPIIAHVQEMMKGMASLANASSPLAVSVVAAAYRSDTQLRDRVVLDIAAVRDTTADLLAALAKVRLIGRPCVIAAADVLRALLQELIERLPTSDNRQFYLRLLFKSKKPDPSNIAAFADCLTALGEANRQFISALRTDHSTRRYTWQVWRHKKCHIRSAKELLDEAGQRSNTAIAVNDRPEPSDP